MKRLFVNGKIFTSNEEQLYAEAMLVEDGRITWVGGAPQARVWRAGSRPRGQWNLRQRLCAASPAGSKPSSADRKRSCALCLGNGSSPAAASHQAAAHVRGLTADFPPSRLISPLRKARARGGAAGAARQAESPPVRSSSAPGRRVTPGHPARLSKL